MGRDSNIEWTHHTFNPWWGCVNVSPACDNCYAEQMGARFGAKWGKDTDRRFFGDHHWNEPLKWDRRAAANGERQRVFCASMADVFEDRRDLDVHRTRLWRLIEETPNLDWLLLTKRPTKIVKLLPSRWTNGRPGSVRTNVWFGTTAENQHWADIRIPELLKVPGWAHFISAEPLLGSITFDPKWVDLESTRHLDWIIVGGESGHNARPMRPDWAQHIRDQCVAAGINFLFKQWGEHSDQLLKIGKKEAGRVLDGRTWDEVPGIDGFVGPN
jgi:protein gp37